MQKNSLSKFNDAPFFDSKNQEGFDTLKRVGKYSFIGILSTLAGFSSFVALSSHFNPYIAAALTEIFIHSIRFLGMYLYVFKSRYNTFSVALKRYVIGNLPLSVVASILVGFLSTLIGPVAGGALGISIIATLGYIINTIVFRR